MPVEKVKMYAVGSAPPLGAAHAPMPVEGVDLAAAKAITDSRERLKIHRILLVETMRRLRAGRQMERVHGVIHPEMTAIVRDALRLAELVFPGGAKPAELADGGSEGAPVRSLGHAQLAALVARSSLAKVARIAGVVPAVVKRTAEGEAPNETHRATFERTLRIPASAWEEPET